MDDAIAEGRRLADYSAGCMIFSLTPGEERVALVLNIMSEENQAIPVEDLKRPRYKDNFVRMLDQTTAVVKFVQPDGFGSPFGKEEIEDGKDRVVTAMRETLEETGRSIEERIFRSVLYTEQPNPRSHYTNTVFAANGLGFQFEREGMKDPQVDARFSDMYMLSQLPVFRRSRGRRNTYRKNGRGKPLPVEKRAGTYQACFRRIIATLLQLEPEHLALMGRPGAQNAEDLVGMVISQVPYGSFFSHRFLRMFSGLNRLDLAVKRLISDDGVFYREKMEKCGAIGRNLIRWLPYKPEDPESLLAQAMQAIVERCEPFIRSDINSYLVERLEEQKNRPDIVSLDKSIGLGASDEKLVVSDDDDLEFEEAQNERERRFAEAVREKEEDE